MEPITGAFLVALATAPVPSVQHMPTENCLARADSQSMCIIVEPPCGGEGEVVCVVEPSPKVKEKAKPQTKRVYYRKNGRTYYRVVRR